ncbi:Wzz/FepE/Etk N-terminal domain-containing protein [Aurantivibrio infirmus]
MSNPAYKKTNRPGADTNDGEIDLLELIAILWRGKWIVIGVVILCATLAFIALKVSPSVFKVEAILDRTSDYQLQRIQPSLLENGVSYQVKEIDLETVYSIALAHADSPYVTRQFWEAKYSDISDFSESERNERYKDFVDFLNVTKPDLETPIKLLSVVTLESTEPKAAENLLREYLKFVDKHTVKELIEQLREAYLASLAKLESDMNSLGEREIQRLEDNLVRLNEAFDIAKSLNIVETPYEQVENVAMSILDNRQYLLGTRVLSEEISSLKTRKHKPLGAFVPLMRDMEHWKEQLERDLKRLENAAELVHAFVIVSPPESSIDPVKPNKLLIFVAVLFASGILGVVIVFTREGIRSYKARSASVE